MRHLLALILGFSLAATARALTWKTTHLDLKVAPLQRTTEAAFEFTNTSDRAVTITSVDTSCDCLEATPSDKVVAPGATGRINARFSLAERYGTLQRTIIVSTDEGTAPTALTAQVEVPEAAALTPRSLGWKIGDAASEQTVDVTIAPELELVIVTVQATSDAFTSRLEAVEAGRRYRLHITPRSTRREANAAFRLHGKTPAGQDVILSIYGNVR